MSMQTYPLQARASSLMGSALLATLVTVLLFLFMERLIHSDEATWVEVNRTLFPSIVSEPPQDDLPLPPEPPIRPIDPSPPPAMPPQSMTFTGGEAAGPLAVLEPPPVDAGTTIKDGMSAVVAFAGVKIQPEYPQAALRRGIEGYVDVRFDVTASGRTSNIRVITAEPVGVFERAAVAAVARWKYQQPMEEGTAVEFRDMETRLRFDIEGR